MIVIVAVGQGDPHYKPFDWQQGSWHHFQGSGEYTIMDVLSDQGVVFTLQGRMDPQGSVGVTWHIGLAFGGPTLAFEVSTL